MFNEEVLEKVARRFCELKGWHPARVIPWAFGPNGYTTNLNAATRRPPSFAKILKNEKKSEDGGSIWVVVPLRWEGCWGGAWGSACAFVRPPRLCPVRPAVPIALLAHCHHLPSIAHSRG